MPTLRLEVPCAIGGTIVRLRRHRIEDLSPFTDFLCDPDSTRFMVFPEEVKNIEGARAMFDDVIAAYDGAAPMFVLAIAPNEGEGFLGVCGASPLSANAVEIFYLTLAEARGTGVASAAVRALVGHLSAIPEVREIVAFIMPGNAPSQRLAERLGFRDAGPMTSHGKSGRRYVMAIGPPADSAKRIPAA